MLKVPLYLNGFPFIKTKIPLENSNSATTGVFITVTAELLELVNKCDLHCASESFSQYLSISKLNFFDSFIKSQCLGNVQIEKSHYFLLS
jgi:hypothetical protein